MKKYLFEYQYRLATCGIEVIAESPEDARLRLQRVADSGQYMGEIQFKVPHLPSLLKRIAEPFINAIRRW